MTEQPGENRPAGSGEPHPTPQYSTPSYDTPAYDPTSYDGQAGYEPPSLKKDEPAQPWADPGGAAPAGGYDQAAQPPSGYDPATGYPQQADPGYGTAPASGTGYGPSSGAGYPASGVGYPASGAGYPASGAGYPASGAGYPATGGGYGQPPAAGYGQPGSAAGQWLSGRPAYGRSRYRGDDLRNSGDPAGDLLLRGVQLSAGRRGTDHGLHFAEQHQQVQWAARRRRDGAERPHLWRGWHRTGDLRGDFVAGLRLPEPAQPEITRITHPRFDLRDGGGYACCSCLG
nr:hypothetical protein [Fodinicola feengrottensis]